MSSDCSVLYLPRDVISLVVQYLSARSDKLAFAQTCSYVRSSTLESDRFLWNITDPSARIRNLTKDLDVIREKAITVNPAFKFSDGDFLKSCGFCITCGLPFSVSHPLHRSCAYALKNNCLGCKTIAPIGEIMPWMLLKRQDLIRKLQLRCWVCTEVITNYQSNKGCMLCKKFECDNCKPVYCPICRTTYHAKKEIHICNYPLFYHVYQALKEREEARGKSLTFYGTDGNNLPAIGVSSTCEVCEPKETMVSEFWICIDPTKNTIANAAKSFQSRGKSPCVSDDMPFLYCVDIRQPLCPDKSIYNQVYQVLTIGEFVALPTVLGDDDNDSD